MNSTPTTTGAVAVSAAMVSSIISWLAGLAHLQMPDQVAGAIAAILLWAVHVLSVSLSAKKGSLDSSKQ